MLTIKKDDLGNSISYRVDSVKCSNIDDNPNRLNISVITQDSSIELSIWTDSNMAAEKAAERIRHSINNDIIIQPFKERNYLYLIDLSLPEDNSEYLLKASGMIKSDI